MGLALRQAGIVVLRLGLAAAGAGALVGLASLGMLMTTAGPALSMLVEPCSLLFLPGIAVALSYAVIHGHLTHHVQVVQENHDFSLWFIVWCTFGFYFLVLLRLMFRRRTIAAMTTAHGSR